MLYPRESVLVPHNFRYSLGRSKWNGIKGVARRHHLSPKTFFEGFLETFFGSAYFLLRLPDLAIPWTHDILTGALTIKFILTKSCIYQLYFLPTLTGDVSDKSFGTSYCVGAKLIEKLRVVWFTDPFVKTRQIKLFINVAFHKQCA